MNKWTKEIILKNHKKIVKKVTEFIKDFPDNMELHDLRFEDENAVAVITKKRLDDKGDYNPDGDYYYDVAWLYPIIKDTGRISLTKDILEDYQDSGFYYEVGFDDSYVKDVERIKKEYPSYIYLSDLLKEEK